MIRTIFSLLSSNSPPFPCVSSNNKTTGKTASGRVRKKKKKVTTNTAGQKTTNTTNKDRQLINSSINSVLNNFNNSDNDSGCSNKQLSTQLDSSINLNGNQQNLNQQTNLQLNTQQSNLIYCDNQNLSANNFNNGQYLNSSSPNYCTTQYSSFNKTQQYNTQFNSINNLSIDNLNNLNNSLNNYLPNNKLNSNQCAKDKLNNKFDRTVMDCKPLINQNLFNSNQQSNDNCGLNIGTYNGKLPQCTGCNKTILDRFLLQTMNSLYHEDCLKCKICDCRLGEVGSSLFTKNHHIYCKRDYLRLFGANGTCAICSKPIPGYELVLKAKNNVYHVDCFGCQLCNHRFCVGDRFYLHDDKILCEYDYSERLSQNQHLSNTSNQLNTNCGAINLRPTTNTPNHISSTQ